MAASCVAFSITEFILEINSVKPTLCPIISSDPVASDVYTLSNTGGDSTLPPSQIKITRLVS